MHAKKPIWYDFSVIGQNKEPGHVQAVPYLTSKEALTKTESPFRRSLNGTWKFHHQFGTQHLPEAFAARDLDDHSWADMPVPSVWQLQGYGKPVYLASSYPKAVGVDLQAVPDIDDAQNEVGIYRRSFQLPKFWAGREIFLCFGAAKAGLHVFVNGQEVGYSQGAMTPAEFDITPHLQPGKNQLTAVVYRYTDGTYFEDQDMWFLSGLYREVFLYAEPKAALRDFYLTTEPNEDFSAAEAALTLSLENRDASIRTLTVSASLSRPGQTVSLGEATAVLNPGQTVTAQLNAHIDNPVLWSAEHPSLYDLLLTISQEGAPAEYKAIRHGIKKVEIRDGVFRINGKAVKLKGANRHDFSPDNGWAVPKETYETDVRLLKQYNFNAVRTSHYPDDPYFYDLCDLHGIYVMDECDLETHGIGMRMDMSTLTSADGEPLRHDVFPGSNPAYYPVVLDRAARMVTRDRHHACVIIWSLGNESGNGDAFVKMYDHIKALDATRPVHYEGDMVRPCSDIFSKMYLPPKAIEMLALGQDVESDKLDIAQSGAMSSPLASAMFQLPASLVRGRPLILCEYAHAMENSLGNFKEYWDVFWQHENIAGAFVWDFVDQSIRRHTPEGPQWLYGGDFEEEESNFYFCANGVVGADRRPQPSLYEAKKVQQGFAVSAEGLPQGQVRITNRHAFTDLSEFQLHWRVETEGRSVKQGTLGDAALPPQSSGVFTIPLPPLPPGETFLTLEFTLKTDTTWASRGHIVACEQLLLQPAPAPEASVPLPQHPLQVQDAGDQFLIENENIRVTISATTGFVTDLCLAGRALLAGPLCPNYFRAMIDNDRGFASFDPVRLIPTLEGFSWQHVAQELRLIACDIQDQGTCIEVTSQYEHKRFNGPVTLTYQVDPAGALRVCHTVTPAGQPYRIGMSTVLLPAYQHFSWYGRGPHETYCDRKTGALVGRYHAHRDALGHHYMRPQENGNRTDVRWLTISDAYGAHFTFRDLTGRHMGFSAHPYSQDELEACTHIHQLPHHEETYLQLDALQCGVGGDLPGMSLLKTAYVIPAGQCHTQAFEIR